MNVDNANVTTELWFLSEKPDDLVRRLFDDFKKGGEWHSSLAKKHRLELLSDAEREAEIKAFYAWFQALSEQERFEYNQAKNVDGFEWVLRTDEFGGSHKVIKKNDLTIHAFNLGYGEAGQSDDPNLYVIYLPGDGSDYSRVYTVAKRGTLRHREWTVEPIAELRTSYLQHGPLW